MTRKQDGRKRIEFDRRKFLKTATVAGVGASGITAFSERGKAAHPGGTVFVDDDATGTEDGSSSNPFDTIQEGIDHAAAGETVKVATGTYNESLDVDKDLTLVGAQEGVDARERDATESIITNPGGLTLEIDNEAAVTVDGFNFDDANRFVRTDNSWGNLKLLNNIFTNAPDSTYIRLRDNPPEEFTFQQNYVHDNGTSNGLRIRAIERRSGETQTPVDATITDNLWEDNGAWALNVNNLKGDISDNEIRNTSITVDDDNEIFDNQWGMIFGGDGFGDIEVSDNEFKILVVQGIDLSFDFVVDGDFEISGNELTDIKNFRAIIVEDDLDGVTLSDNEVKDTDGNGIEIDDGNGATIEGNEVKNSTDDGIRVEGSSSSNTIKDNEVEGSGADGIHLLGDTSGNTVKENEMKDSGGYDAHDESSGSGTAGTANTWEENECENDNPDGLCEEE